MTQSATSSERRARLARAARFVPGVVGAALIVVSLSAVHPVLAGLAAGGFLLLVDRRL